ncbi:MAG: 3-hydroxyacyl-ACP dehydratase FabZ [bacterium]
MSTNEELKLQNMDILEIMNLIPHRYPFLLVDRIIECVPGKYVKGYKNVTVNEPFFTGHFPKRPIMPGVLIIEAMAQLSAGIIMTLPEYKGKLALFAGIDNARFKKIVIPGDKLEIYSEIIKMRGPVCKTKCTATVDEKLVTEAELMCSIQ